ncbi:MAG: hypothetical protein DMD89_35845 [Candidatus Rokuibacteriota bacterium]|nr:MAG: hypothetical protein DMD89_35845 [Candidatus Rokubacteria bacterium]
MGGQMARGQGSPVRDKAEWLLRFAVMSLVTPRDFRRLRREAHRWLDPDGARPLELGELRDVQAHIQRGLKALRRRQPWEHRVPSRHVLLSGAKGLHGPLSPRVETLGPSDRYVINAMDVLTAVGDRLRTCKRPGCGRAFIAVKRQEHCIDCAKADSVRGFDRKLHVVPRRPAAFGADVRGWRHPPRTKTKPAHLSVRLRTPD